MSFCQMSEILTSRETSEVQPGAQYCRWQLFSFDMLYREVAQMASTPAHLVESSILRSTTAR